MSIYETRSRVASDGTLRLKLPPEMADAEVRITVEPASNGAVPAPDARPRTTEEWREFIRATRGSIPDFPDVDRPGPGDYERRDW
jgi:hypothetical protein